MDRTLARESIRLDAMSYGIGEAWYSSCPFCEAQHERSLKATKVDDGVVLFICHRVSCGAKGRVGFGHYDSSIIPTPATSFKPRIYDKETLELSTEMQEYLRDKYELTDYRGIRYEPERNALVFSLLTASRSEFGVMIKREFGVPKGSPKCKIYMHREVPRVHYSPPIGRGTVVLVEDYLSAKKLSAVVPTCALLGTHLSDDVAMDLSKYYDTLVLALDYDAVERARKIKRNWSCLFNVSIKILRLDVKDTPYSELTKVFSHEGNHSTNTASTQ